MTNVTQTTLSHINTLVLAAISYQDAVTIVRSDYAAGKLSRDNAKIALATAYVHHKHTYADQRDAETGKALRSTALEQQVNRMLRDITNDADKMSAKAETRDSITLTAAQVRLLKELDATFETYTEMRKGIASYIATASAK
jgi:hypothetical protein